MGLCCGNFFVNCKPATWRPCEHFFSFNLQFNSDNQLTFSTRHVKFCMEIDYKHVYKLRFKHGL
jgi:hypothetical protein